MEPIHAGATSPLAFVGSVLAKIAALDREGYFQYPVDEVLQNAPNYYKIIKQPLCFSDMKKKLSTC